MCVDIQWANIGLFNQLGIDWIMSKAELTPKDLLVSWLSSKEMSAENEKD